MPDAGDQYELLGLIDSGHFGEVYRARHQYIRDQVRAVKLIQHQQLSDRDALLDEARKHSAIGRHDNVAEIFDAGIWSDGRVFIAMELCAGGSLEALSKRAAVDPTSACRYLSEACRGLDFVHEQDLLHLDIRPANILFDEDDTPKLVDFGLSRWASDALVDTWYLPHAAPELYESGHANRTTDVFAMGMTLAHLLTNGDICTNVPLGSDIVMQSANGEWPRFEIVGAHVPGRIIRLLKDATDYAQQARPATARDFRRRLDNVTPVDSFLPVSPGEWLSASQAWTIQETKRRSGIAIDVRHGGRRRGALSAKGLTEAQARGHMRRVVTRFAYPS